MHLMTTYVRTVVAAIFLAVSPAWGQGSGVGSGRIGSAFKTRGTVESNVQGRAYPLTQGGVVYQDQYVNTRKESEAGLELLNQSRFHVGPSSSVKLDKKVYDPKTQTDHVSLHLGLRKEKQDAASGVLKTTPNDPATYHVSTPQGVLTARGR